MCRWTNGFCKAVSPAIHILAGEKVCIHRIKPAQWAAALASRQTSRIDCGVVTIGLKITRTRQAAGGIEPFDHAAAVVGDLAEGRLAVKMLTAGDEPDFQGLNIHPKRLHQVRLFAILQTNQTSNVFSSMQSDSTKCGCLRDYCDMIGSR